MQSYGDDLAAEVTSKLTGANLQQQDKLAVAQNGGLTGSQAEDAEMADAEGDDGMDDDMMDKISSSPSIDDGGYSLPKLWPQRLDSIARTPPVRIRPYTQACCESSSPFVQTPDHFPLLQTPGSGDKDADHEAGSSDTVHHHLPGEYPDDEIDQYEERSPDDDKDRYEERSEDGSESNYEGLSMEYSSPRRVDSLLPYAEDYTEEEEDYDKYYDLDQLAEEILASDLDILNGIIEEKVADDSQEEDFVDESYRDEEPEIPSSDDPPAIPEMSSLELEDLLALPTIPLDSEDEEDDDYVIPTTADDRFIDSGWGGECLQELEDIDFEFVYALHTFVATVEGQANATKGDTMVLLDDSNSYWWLVRVVKDSSIGEFACDLAGGLMLKFLQGTYQQSTLRHPQKD